MNAQILDKNELSCRIPPRRCELLDEALMQALLETEYRFGTLHFSEPRIDDDCRGAPNQIATWVHEIDMVLHPDRGALLLRSCSLESGETRQKLFERIRKTHSQLADLQRKIRSRLDADPFWRGRPVVLGIGVVIRRQSKRCQLPFGVPPELVIHESDLDDLPARLQRLFDYYATPETVPVEDYGPQLISALTESAEMGRFFDEAAVIELYNRLYDDFGPSEEVA